MVLQLTILAKEKLKPQPPKPPVKAVQENTQQALIPGEIKISYPLLWLALAAIVLYFPSFSFGFTELDDSIFIRDFQEYNEHAANILGAFGRGLFNATKDPYYRPIFSDSMILNYMISGIEIGSYHVVNVLLHIASILLLYKLFIKLHLKPLHTFVLCAIFTVHPVLTQAVAWIPGRNDTLLAIFVLAFFNHSIAFAEKGQNKNLLLASLFLLLAFFTKETAVFAAPAAFVILIVALQYPLKAKRSLILFVSWAACFAVWFTARSLATVHIATQIERGKQVADFFNRIPVILQYLGKIFIPVNLSVFPTQQDTVYYFGLIAIAILAALIYFSKAINWRMALSGIGVFLLFLLPALLVPGNLNEQTFEHRLYLPMVGMLLLLSQTAFIKNFTDKILLVTASVIIILFAGINYKHQQHFSSPLSFWTQATETSPNSAYANMMLGAREPEVQKSYDLFHKAYRLNPKEKYLNFYYGCMLQKRDSVIASEPYFLAEKNSSNYYECDFYLARVAMMKSDTVGAINYLQTYLKRDEGNPQANNNLLLMYYTRRQIKEAKAQAAKMQVLGLPVPGELLQQLNALH